MCTFVIFSNPNLSRNSFFISCLQFGPNNFGMFEKKGVGFKQIQRKKRLDRILQVAIIGSVLTGIGKAIGASIRKLAHVTGQSPLVVSASMVLVGALAGVLQKALQQRKAAAATEAAAAS